jgi:hypothetical protein
MLCSISADAKDFKGAELFSKEQVRYGRWETRMQMAHGNGLLSTFFTYFSDSWRPGYMWHEIDIEVLGRDTNNLQSNIMTGTSGTTMSVEHYFAQANLTTSYHTYTLQWTPDSVSWFLDGILIRTTTGAQVVDLQDQVQSYRMNIWSSNNTGWVGVLDAADLPAYQYVNWMRYSAYTPGAGDEGSDFTFQWQDDFDSFDAGRWNRSSSTFNENQADFLPDNLVFKDGCLILCLTTATQTGHRGLVPVDAASQTPVAPRAVRVAAAPERFTVRCGKRELNLHFARGVADLSTLTIAGLNGRVVYRQSTAGHQGSLVIPFAAFAHSSGVYTVTLSNRDVAESRVFSLTR